MCFWKVTETAVLFLRQVLFHERSLLFITSIPGGRLQLLSYFQQLFA